MLRRLGRFELLERLGQGAMGEVYLARDPVIGREVALKTIHREVAQGAEARERFAQEARAAGTLNHPNLVTIHEFGEDQGVLYLAMELVPGVDLEALLRDRALPPVEALEVLAQVCDGLAYAHQKGILHRDIKPSNIRVHREGERLLVKVMDFGIARMAGSDLTGTGTLLGTFGYMAPEYIRTGLPDPRSDLFAVGVILYEALAGHRPFEGDTTATVLYRVVNEEPPPVAPSDLRGISPQAGLLLAKALAKEPGQRFQTAEAMARALRDARDPAWAGPPSGQPTRALPRSMAPAAASRDRAPGRRAWPWIAALLILGGLGMGAWSRLRRPGRPPRTLAFEPPPPTPAPAPAAPEGKPDPKPNPAPVPAPKAASRPVQVEKPPAKLSEQEALDLLNEAAQGLADQPQGSLDRCDRVLRDHPENARAYALKAAALYGLGRYREMPAVLDAGREHGVRPAQYLAFGHFTAMLREERRERRMPPEAREALVADLPAGGMRPGLGLRQRPRPSDD